MVRCGVCTSAGYSLGMAVPKSVHKCAQHAHAHDTYDCATPSTHVSCHLMRDSQQGLLSPRALSTLNSHLSSRRYATDFSALLHDLVRSAGGVVGVWHVPDQEAANCGDPPSCCSLLRICCAHQPQSSAQLGGILPGRLDVCVCVCVCTCVYV
jgi:hypothetical protein